MRASALAAFAGGTPAPMRLRGALTVLGLFCALAAQAGAATVWPADALPATEATSDTGAVEVGVKFTADTDGIITGIRFYKGPGNDGPHVVSLWKLDSTRLAQAAVVNETATGWQQVNFTTPVSVKANTTYVASYHAPLGHYAVSSDYFATQGTDNAPLHAPSNAEGGNGVFTYGAQSVYPRSSYRASNYWVDVVFEPVATEPPPPVTGAGPVLLVTSSAAPFTKYYAEILRTEGLNAFASTDLANLSSELLAAHDVVLLGSMPLSAAQVSLLTNWVNGGGKLVAMQPDRKLGPLLGLADLPAGSPATTLADAYLLVNTSSGPGAGIVNQTIQFHGTADLFTLNGATALATLYSGAGTPTPYPAASLRTAGAGQAAAFTYDLARSVAYTHQGNPAWAGQERDNAPPQAIRPDDLFFPGYVDLDKVAIPQAEEQQRLLANLIIQMNLAKKPLPRFWYLPHGHKAALVHALDDHATATGTHDSFAKLLANSAPGCSLDDWECLRGTAWVYSAVVTDAQAADYNAQGLELGVHVENQGCTNFSSYGELDQTYTAQLGFFQEKHPSLPPQTTHRYHCIVWSDWATQAKVAAAHGIRYSMDYYYWPAAWVNGRPGLFTGAGMPMRFVDLDGTTLDIYQGVSQLVNENGLSYPSAVDVMLDRAYGPEGYYGLFGTHDDYRDSAFSDGLISSALARKVPIISARQALVWLDARNASTFGDIAFSGDTLSFTLSADPQARGLQAMLPAHNGSNALSALAENGTAVPYTVQTIKGIAYAFFNAPSGSYTATYAAAIPPAPAGGLTLWPANTVPPVAAVNDPQAVELGVKFQSDRTGLLSGIRFYKGAANTGPFSVTLWTADGTPLASAQLVGATATGWQQVNFAAPVNIQANTPYVASYHTGSGNYAATNQFFAATGVDSGPLHALPGTTPGGNGVYAYGAGAFPTGSYQATNYWVDVVFKDLPPATLWSTSSLPAQPAVNETATVELGIKFTADVNGKVKGIRFYKGSGNNGTHTATLWDSSGTPLATATFTDETPSGWQEVLFSTPVSITAGTTYVASYFAPQGHYAVDGNYFANSHANPPLRAPASGPAGSADGNGVFRYAPTGGFPNQSYNASNYWVDVLFLAD